MTGIELLQHIAAISYKQSDQVLQEQLGIGMSQYKIMALLDDRPSNGQRAIAASLGQTEASISRQIKLMTGRGLLVTQVDPDNRRVHLTILAAKGKKLLQAAQEVLSQTDQALWSTLVPKQSQQAALLLETLHTQICQPDKPHSCAKQ